LQIAAVTWQKKTKSDSAFSQITLLLLIAGCVCRACVFVGFCPRAVKLIKPLKTSKVQLLHL